jgi:hypothetical protein
MSMESGFGGMPCVECDPPAERQMKREMDDSNARDERQRARAYSPAF